MARLGEVSYVLKKMGPFTFVRRIVKEISDDGLLNMAAAVAFYWLLALFPFIIFLMALTPMLPLEVRDLTLDKLRVWTSSNLPQQAAEPVLRTVEEVIKVPRGGLFSLSLLFTLWAASNGMNATMGALDRCYDITKPRNYFLQRGVAIVITIAMVVILLLVIVLLPVTSLVLKLLDTRFISYAPDWMGGPTRALIDVGRYFVGVSLVVLLVSSIYQFGVSIRRRWTLITPGAVFSVLGVMALAFMFNLYIQKFGAASYAKTYGALGGIIILQLLFYLYAVVFLIGAEINSEIDYAVLGAKNDEGTDPLPHIHSKEELERFRKQLEHRQSKLARAESS
jgi:membrane protein